MGLGKGRKVPQSVKTQRKIDAAINQVASEKDRYWHKILVQQSTRHVAEVGELKQSFVSAELTAESSDGLVVPNWKQGWKWISNWSLLAIGYVAAYGIPPELIATLPQATQAKVILGLSVIGFVGRFLNQSRNPPQSPFNKGGSMVDLKEGLNDHPA